MLPTSEESDETGFPAVPRRQGVLNGVKPKLYTPVTTNNLEASI
jgi:hypothetical protein